ncbi:hypothetical protein EDB81DRAFT_933194 [Dactylonectria macrodidyma]|uniref:Uncharacterized protein n=1 Tax=Dactylonectria macrodidyma TaxID=307937 RepID=A0A9P9EYA1_9HYPO|nr:hypothetical protein EDB81DRAFT_933194 [Dactylonectria macrodidyma]
MSFVFSHSFSVTRSTITTTPAMASTTVTYGKKRSLLRSLGSRRRQKHLAESLQTKKKEPFAISAPALSETPRRTPRRRTSRHANSIEEMASRLLDDSTTTPQELNTPHVLKTVSSLDQSPPTKSLKFRVHLATSPRQVSPRFERPVLSSEARIKTKRVEKNSPKSSTKVLKQPNGTRPRVDSSQRRKETGLQRPLTQSKTQSLNPLKSHPTPKLRESTSVPLGHVDGNLRSRKPVDADPPKAAVASADPEDINNKLHAMLAATESLKPSTPQNTNSSTSKLTRMVSSRVFAKMSHAWDRIHSKSSFETPRGHGKGGMQDQYEQGDELIKTSLPSPAVMPPISTIEIRLNEGDNLNKKKVQRIVGGQVARKPVADDGKSLRSGKSLDDPFGECGMARTPTSFESRLKKEVDYESDIIPPVPRNPFETEEGFDTDLEDRILSTPPVGSSTPRIRVERVSTPSPEESPTAKKRRSPLLQMDSAMSGVTGLEREELMQARPLELIVMRACDRRLVGPMTRLCPSVVHTAPKIDFSGPNRVKKHPSPSKEALEDLEVAFRKYTRLKSAGVHSEEVDELATSFVSISPCLTQRDKNRPISNRLSASNIEELASPSACRGHNRPLSSSAIPLFSLPRQSDNLRKICGEIRLAPPFRPKDAERDDVDELH